LYVAGHDRLARRTSVSVGRGDPFVFPLTVVAMMPRSSPPPHRSILRPSGNPYYGSQGIFTVTDPE
jgi:hypothetical protein